MLVLSRKQDQTVIVDNRITITVLKIRGNAVRLGIEAPLDVPVRRGELEVDLPDGVVEFKNHTSQRNAKSQVRISVQHIDEASAASMNHPESGFPHLAEGF